MSNSDKRIVIITEDELRQIFSRLRDEIIEKDSDLDNQNTNQNTNFENSIIEKIKNN